MWKDYIQSVTTGYHFKPPAIKSEISQIKEKLYIDLPLGLSELFDETNGVFGEFDIPLIW